MAKKKILVVEDEESVRSLVCILLKSKGYIMRAVPNGQAALDALAEETPDLVLLDIMLPDISGFEICSHIKSEMSTRHVPVIMLTAMKTREYMERGQEVGADSYLAKPFTPAMVIETIQRLLGECGSAGEGSGA